MKGDVAVSTVNAGEHGYVVCASSSRVEAWSTVRLPYEPAGWLIDFRQTLRAAVSTLRSSPDQLLHAMYASKSVALVDVENVLLYNVGMSAFRRASHCGIRLERSFTPPPTPPEGTWSGRALDHYHRYSRAPIDGGFSAWTVGPVLASFDDVDCTDVRKPGSVFAAIRRTRRRPGMLGAAPSRFGLRLSVAPPRDSATDLTSVLKPLLDGVISAYHAHNGTDLTELATRLAHAGAGPPAAALQDLEDQRWQALGRRCLVRRFRESVQWNPADDLCVAADIRFRQDAPTERWRLSGEVLHVLVLDPDHPERQAESNEHR
jgi:hypothetical protein